MYVLLPLTSKFVTARYMKLKAPIVGQLFMTLDCSISDALVHLFNSKVAL